jgi:cbb3-type cytochrome oxidase maturation protein
MNDGMEIMYLLVPVSIVLVFVIGAIFWWSLKSGQFDDLDGPGYRVIMDDDTDARPPPRADAAAHESPITDIDRDQDKRDIPH